MPDAKVTYPTNTTFGNRINELKAEKMAVAKRIVDEFLGNGTSVFLGDGSSTFYVGLELFARQEQATVWTNHLAIAHEFSVWASSGIDLSRMSLDLAGGHVDRNLMMTYGVEAERFVDEVSRRAQSVVLSVRDLFAHEGPSGVEQNSLAIKQVCVRQAAQSGAKIILAADHSKLSRQYQRANPLVYRLTKDWDDILRSDSIYVVTTRHPRASGPPSPVPKPVTEEDWYCHHAWLLRQIMKRRFIEI